MAAAADVSPSSTAGPAPFWLRRSTAAALTALYAAWAWALLTNFDGRPFAPEKLGQVFGDMARRMLSWDFTVSLDAIQFEAFIRNGVTYAYYGIFPALLRMPLVPFGLEGLEVARLSCLVALAITVFCTLRTLQLVLDGAGAMLAAAAVLSAVLTGPQIFVLASAALYHELIFWSAALTASFQLIVVRAWMQGHGPTGRGFLALAALAGCCLLCRTPDGVGLYVALLLLLLLAFVQHVRALPAGRRLPLLLARPARPLTLFAAGGLALLFVAVQGVVNLERWGDPLEASPYAHYQQFVLNPDAAARYERHGLFSWVRVPLAVAYYGTGVKLEAVVPELFTDYYGGIEGPRAVVPLTAPLLFLLAAAGFVALVRRARATLLPGLVAIGGLAGLLPVLGFLALCLRYAFDGWGLLVLLAAIGLRTLPGRGRPGVGVAALLLLLAGIAGSHLTLLRYKIVYSGTDPAVRFALSQRLQPLLCPRARLDPAVKLTDFNPLVTPNCPPLW